MFHSTRVQCFLALLFIGHGGPASAQQCPTSYQHLASEVPSSNHPELEKQRNRLLRTSSQQVAQVALGQGYNLFQAAAFALKQAESLKQTPN